MANLGSGVDSASVISEESSSKRLARKRLGLIIAGAISAMVIMAIFIALIVVRVPYVIIAPGSATLLDKSIIQIPDNKTYPHAGGVLYLTVRVSDGDPSVLRWLLAKVDDDVSIEPREEVIGCATYSESARLNEALMDRSQNSSRVAALTHLGYTVRVSSTSVYVTNVGCDAPAFGKLQLGDEIVSIDGEVLNDAAEVKSAVQAHAPGEIVELIVRRDEDELPVSVKLAEKEGMGYLGIFAETINEWQFPVDIRIDTDRVSGPSAGLAFSLAIIDELSPENITNGRRVAVTGSIRPDGIVEPVGGVAQKAIAARASGAKMMLVPKGEAKIARRAIEEGELKVVAVDSLTEALAALKK